ncbi:MAG TPA: recombinase family protein [Amycolatopsis sp.]|uniref:recombinase family protein n=1 Tax=Amycolatopsis sp. TaxID=37632 RepID=UPI002B47ACCB|nr:recombinase family protein [Amycolatopsis sp.]HKS43729.1 recombinase family protein [Amycolatopsis sp.]
MSHHPQPPNPATPAEHASRLRVAVYLVGTGITTAVRACLNAHPTWRRTRHTYHDPKPGQLATRPELRRALTDAHAGKLDVLLVDSVSQVSRTLDDLTEILTEILTELDDAGLALHSAPEPHVTTTTATGRMVTRLMVAFAQYEEAHRAQARRRAVR